MASADRRRLRSLATDVLTECLPGAERLAARREHSTPCYDDMVSWCRAYEPDVPPKSPLGRAIGYLLKHQLALRRFESDGGIPIDNMAAEHNFVPVALTRKNFLFAGRAENPWRFAASTSWTGRRSITTETIHLVKDRDRAICAKEGGCWVSWTCPPCSATGWRNCMDDS
ncbi:IS66 family transposase [Enhygromyxa salina]|uniref:IS66 family transposase n=1 Tax=Enhygromyxa salina TaxID=215803 RepID=UPI0015E5E425